MSLSEDTGIIASPVASRPTRALIQELDVVLESGFDLAFTIVLDPSCLLVCYQPASDKVVIISVELKLAPPLGLETVQEQGSLQDFGPEGAGASGHAGGATINVVCRGDLKVTPLDIRRTKPIEHNIRDRAGPDSLDSLTGPDTPNFRTLERSQQPWENGSRPRDIVVRHDCDTGLHVGDSLTNLDTLVRDRYVEYSDIRSFKGLDKSYEFLVLVGRGDQE